MFKASNVDVNGMSLITYGDGLDMKEIARRFPEGVMEGYYDPEKGYTDPEVGFLHISGVPLYVYARWGMVRVGGYADNHLTAEAAKDLIQFLRNGVMS